MADTRFKKRLSKFHGLIGVQNVPENNYVSSKHSNKRIYKQIIFLGNYYNVSIALEVYLYMFSLTFI